MSEVVIIGSGLGGLTCGYILQKNGYDVTILEQGVQAGGCLQCFVRGGVKFETGMHFIGSAAKGQIIDRMMQYFGLRDDLVLSPLDADAYNTVDLAGDKFGYAVGKEAFAEKMAGYFPSQKDAIYRYVSIIEDIARVSSIRSLTSAQRNIADASEYQTLPINAVMDSIFTDPLLKNVLVGDLPLYAARYGRTPFALHAFIMDFYNNSSYRIVGGSDAISSALIRNIEAMGGKILTCAKARRIVCDDTKATGVETEDSRFYAADYVISTIHPKRMVELLDTKLIRPAYRSRINSIPETSSVFSLYVKFRENTVPYMNTNYFRYDGNSPWGCEEYSDSSWPKGFIYMHMCHKNNPVWAKGGIVMSYMNMNEVAGWMGTKVGRRGEDYEEFKKNRAQRLIASVEKTFPGFAASIESYYTATPLTYYDYTGTEAGSIYGISKDVNLGPAGRVMYRTKIPNLLLAGQNVNSHGIMGVIVGTMLTCAELVPSEKLYRQILEADI